MDEYNGHWESLGNWLHIVGFYVCIFLHFGLSLLNGNWWYAFSTSGAVIGITIIVTVPLILMLRAWDKIREEEINHKNAN